MLDSEQSPVISDLHAADARYHQECKILFLHSKFVKPGKSVTLTSSQIIKYTTDAVIQRAISGCYSTPS